MNDSVKSVVSLVVICLVVTLALSAVNYFTAPVIAENNAKAVQGSFAEALPGADGFEELEPAADAPETVKSIYKENNGLGYYPRNNFPVQRIPDGNYSRYWHRRYHQEYRADKLR